MSGSSRQVVVEPSVRAAAKPAPGRTGAARGGRRGIGECAARRSGGMAHGRATAVGEGAFVLRWTAFSCALAPVLLLACGASFGGAAGIATALVATAAGCRALLRRSERAAVPHAARRVAEGPALHLARHGRGRMTARSDAQVRSARTPVE
ncbi:hypothetical protein LRS74_21875 [Streptomyces sp. LX-29]|uniref:hypothetical protein n=1 Tax=Streptomyces sp. LX-29 TaxID=2900152 RepID=UPI00240CF0C1|nr:hypothetical protein [Streptomyces sp. LX-29]WFB09395.1 hypothetical protein LRS74_21875 [Streptomyces sp. LX-29]